MAQGKAAVIRSDLDIVIARTLARDTAKTLGFGAIDQARIATAVSELARNIFLYAGTGTVTVREVERSGRKGLEVICEDQGPGITSIDQVMQVRRSPVVNGVCRVCVGCSTHPIHFCIPFLPCLKIYDRRRRSI